MEVPRWARIKGDVNCSVRRGAWYEVLRVTPDAAIVDVEHRSVSIPRELLDIAPTRPRRWSVVPRPYDAVDIPLSWGSRYAVCPACRGRAPLSSHEQTELRCRRCGETAPIDWGHPF